MSIENRIAMNRHIAEGYRNAYMKKAVAEGENYDGWSFAADAEYVSPYWTNDEIWIISELPIDALKTATMEALAINIVYDDWIVVDCQIWAAEDGFVMKNKWTATHKRDRSSWSYYSYTFARTNAQGQITRWETHVNDQYGPFIAEVIGTAGPFATQSHYMDPIAAVLDKNGISY